MMFVYGMMQGKNGQGIRDCWYDGETLLDVAGRKVDNEQWGFTSKTYPRMTAETVAEIQWLMR